MWSVPELNLMAQLIGELEFEMALRTDELIAANEEIQKEIAERERVDQRVLRAKREWETSVDTVSELILLTDEKGAIVRCNRPTIRYLGTSYQDLIGMSVDQAFFGDVVPGRIRMLEIDDEVQFPGMKGWFKVNSYTVTLEHGELRNVYVVRDVTERIESHAEIQRQKQYFESLVNNSPVAVVILDLEHKIVSLNPAFETLFGYREEEALGWLVDDLIVTETDYDEAVEFTKVAQEGGMVHKLGLRRRKDGTLVDVEIFGVPVIVDEELVGVLGLYHNVSELVAARQEAEKANTAKTEFLANMSHEIRTPMNGVIGMLELALDTSLTEEQIDFLVTARDSADALLILLNDILDISKIAAGQLDLEIIDFDPRSTVEGVAHTLAARADAKNLEMACMIYHDVPARLRGDPGRLRQVITNLVGNAIKFTHDGEVVIRVTQETETDTHIKLKFAITDTGIGIPADRTDKIFERFTQVDSSTTRKYGGTGLGLAISQQLSEIMGGEIGVESELGVGSTFWFTAKFEKVPDGSAERLVVPVDLQEVRVLVIDDNATNCMILNKVLENFGCTVWTVNNGMQALNTLRAAVKAGSPYRLVLLDMQMPEMDGEQVLQAIKSDPEIADTIIVVLTSIGARGDAARLEAMGCAGYLLKPIKQRQLYEALVSVLGQRHEKVGEQEPQFVTRHFISEQLRQSTRILLAEDNHVNQKVVVTLLQKAGYPVDVVENGKQAMEALEKNRYNLVFMDVQMPTMDGLEATRLIRKRESSDEHIPIIAMTAHAMKGDQEICLEAGMDDYLSKPLNPDKVFALIEKWISDGEALREVIQEEVAAEVPPDTDAPVDLETALPRFANDIEFFNELLGEFVEQLIEQHQQMTLAAQEGDSEGLARVAHTLKGLSSNFSATVVNDAALRLETQGKEGKLNGTASDLAAIEAEIPRLQAFLEAQLAEPVQ